MKEEYNFSEAEQGKFLNKISKMNKYFNLIINTKEMITIPAKHGKRYSDLYSRARIGNGHCVYHSPSKNLIFACKKAKSCDLFYLDLISKTGFLQNDDFPKIQKNKEELMIFSDRLKEYIKQHELEFFKPIPMRKAKDFLQD